ncbi:zinc-binding dehydrogenase [Tenggerimyces flavus]|uniref:Zinc-binding dehydrogenase n=1 Tax=Tenggerimyces flavus TaxID=1708749 RepID=A0ABV7YES1_9ACTN|nr:zinc-binding dehydrogenase [Tenggerimyces flavus]MBM7786806.1 threonine dehydrogenase-like Zn-dependent dehydrogenase [Tenggerimyces flavus]
MPQVLTLVGPRSLEIRKVEAQSGLLPGQARLRSVVSGISHGTELNLYRGTSPFHDKDFDREARLFRPRAEANETQHGIGYELVSEVVEVATDVTALAVGDLVHSPNGHCDELVVDVARAMAAELPLSKLPPTDKPERGVFLALAGVALNATHDANVKLGDTVMVSGLGVIGQLIVQLARLNGATTVIGVDPVAARRELAETFGATTIDPKAVEESVGWSVHQANGGVGVDTAIETSGTYRGLHAAIASVAVGGRIVSVGFFRGDAGSDLALGEEWHHNRPQLVSSMGVWACPHRDYPRWNRPRVSRTVNELLFGGQLRVDELLTERVPFADAPSAYAKLDDDPEATMKIALTYR